VSSSSAEPEGIPRSSDGVPKWPADTDPVGPITPGPAFVDPGTSQNQLQREETMSTADFGDPNLGQAPTPAPVLDGLTSPLTPPVEPFAPAAPLPPTAAAETPAIPVNDMHDVPLGTLVFRAGLLAEEQLEEALQDGMRRGKRLGEVLLERGLVSEGALGRLLAGQKGLRFVELDAAAIDPAAVQLLPVEKARLHSMLPIGFQDGVPVVAVADPSNDLVIENVRRALNCEPYLVVAGREALHRQIELAYAATPNGGPQAASAEQPASALTPEVPAVSVQPAAQSIEAANGDGVWLGTPGTPLQPETPALRTPESPPQSLAVSPPPALEAPALAAQPVAAPEMPASTPLAAEAPAPAPQDVAHEQVEENVVTWSVAVRLQDGDRIEIGTFRSDSEAKEHAQGVVRQLLSEHGWPFFDSRFIRPDAIVSIDLVENETGRWLGSSVRAQAWRNAS
jgi:hypothetical protein